MYEPLKPDQFKNLLAFCVLMGDEKVLTKSPDYIIEKYRRYIDVDAIVCDNDAWTGGIHPILRTKVFDEYIKKWGVE